MKLESFLKEYSNIRLATDFDSSLLSDFFSTSPMDSSSLKLSYERNPNFERFLSYQGEESYVFCMFSDDKLVGVASMSIREGYVKGELVRVAYLGDLRVKKELMTKELSSQWKRCMGSLIEKYMEIEQLNAKYLITVIMKNNKAAKRALVNHPKNKFHYEKISEYSMVNIVHKFLNQSRVYNIKRFSVGEEGILLDFLESEQSKLPFGYSRKFFINAFRKFHNFKIENFVGAFRDNQLVGVTAFWNPSPVKKIIIEKFPISLKALNFILAPFTKTPKEKEELKVQYMSFLTVQKGYESCINDFVGFFKEEKGFSHFDLLAFSDFKIFPKTQLIKSSIKDETQLEFYQVVPKSQMDKVLEINSILGFEMSLV